MLQNFEGLFKETKRKIESNSDFLIITHDFPDGDSLGSQIALYELLKLLGKNIEMICNSEIPYQYKFLPHIKKIKATFDVEINVSRDKKNILFCLDSADKGRFNIRINDLNPAVIINIDHHLGNTEYGDINIIDSRKSATAEILYEFIEKEYPKHMNYNIALCLYTAILTDTGRFQYENTTSSVHRIISQLLKFGIVPSDVFSQIYENEPLNRFKLLERVLKRIKVINSKKIVYSYLLQSDFKKLGLPFSANDGVIELLRSASSAKIAVLFKQIKGNRFKVSLRSSDISYNVADIAKKFGGGGHRMASAYSANGSLMQIIFNLLNEIEDKQVDLL